LPRINGQSLALEKFCICNSLTLPKQDNQQITKFTWALGMYVDDFIGMAAAPSHNDLLYFI